MKRNTHTPIRCRSLKKYSADIYKEALGKLHILNDQNFENINNAYSLYQLHSESHGVIDLVTPIKSRRIKTKLTRMVRW